LKILKTIIFALVTVLLATGLYIGYLIKPDHSLALPEDNKEDVTANLETVNPFKGDDPLHILVMGIDSTATTDMTEDENPSRSDTMMLFTIDPVRKKVQVLSLPRDTYIKIPGYAEKTKLGHAYAYGGYLLAEETIEDFLDIKIDHYGIVDYKAVERLVDAIGGIDVVMDQDYYYEDTYVVPPLVIDFKKGKNYLDGKEAVNYLRIRKMYEDQDIGRIQKQQEFLLKVLEKVKKPSIILKVPELIDIAQKHSKTDLSYGQIAYLAKFALDLDKEDIITDTLVGDDQRIGDLDYYIVDEELAREQVRRFKEGKGSYYQEVQEQKESNENSSNDEE